MLHQYFLKSEENRQKFFITEPEFYPFDLTINVNFIAIHGEDFPKTFELTMEKLQKRKHTMMREPLFKTLYKRD
jgi:hypothetical protein